MKSHTVKQVARMSGVSVRTLHFYDEIGLLKPAYYGENGYRYYEKEQLLVLQQILFYRELEIPIEAIRELLFSSDFDKIAALEAHRRHLAERGERLQRLLGTIDKTIKHLKGDTPMKDQELYYGFAPEKQREYEAYLIEKGGVLAARRIQESKERLKHWKKEDYERIRTTIDTIHRELTALLNGGGAPGDPEVQAVMKRHYDWIAQFWTPDKVSYPGLGQLYLDHPDFRKTYEAYHPQLVFFLVDAMKIFAERSL